MLLGFQDQFVPMVEDGSKTHTIRGGQRCKVGIRADLYRESRRPKAYNSAGVQVSGMRLIFRAPVIKVERIKIVCSASGTGLVPLAMRTCVEIEGNKLSVDELDALAWRDGFRRVDLRPASAPEVWGCFGEMMRFWESTHAFGSRIMRFEGQIIHWDYAERFTDVTDTCYHLTRAQARRFVA